MLKELGYQWENLVKLHYQKQWFQLLSQNYTIPGGEIDLIFGKENTIVFVEVKVVDGVDDIFNYLSQKKLKALWRAIHTYCMRPFVQCDDVQLDVVFVKWWKIREVYDAIEL